MTRICPDCTKENLDSAASCVRCGTPLGGKPDKDISAVAGACGRCGAPLHVGQDACERCGAPASEKSVAYFPAPTDESGAAATRNADDAHQEEQAARHEGDAKEDARTAKTEQAEDAPSEAAATGSRRDLPQAHTGAQAWEPDADAHEPDDATDDDYAAPSSTLRFPAIGIVVLLVVACVAAGYYWHDQQSVEKRAAALYSAKPPAGSAPAALPAPSSAPKRPKDARPSGAAPSKAPPAHPAVAVRHKTMREEAAAEQDAASRRPDAVNDKEAAVMTATEAPVRTTTLQVPPGMIDSDKAVRDALRGSLDAAQRCLKQRRYDCAITCARAAQALAPDNEVANDIISRATAARDKGETPVDNVVTVETTPVQTPPASANQ